MRGIRVYTLVLLASPLVASPLAVTLCGCADKEDESRPEPQPYRAPGGEARAEGILLSDVLASWESGKKEDALKQLLSIRWDGPAVFADMPMMNLSEQGFVSLPVDERTRIQEELLELTGTLRGLARHTLSAGESAQASGDQPTARAHYEAVLQLGQALSSPERVLLLQGLGKGLAKLAEDRLSALK